MVLQHAPDGTPLRPLDDSTHDVAIHLANMDIAGIDMAVLSGPEVGTLDDVRLFNDNFADVVSRHPNRFAAFATTLPLGGKPALDELERAVKGLGVKGVLMNAQVSGEPVDSRRGIRQSIRQRSRSGLPGRRNPVLEPGRKFRAMHFMLSRSARHPRRGRSERV